MTDATQHEILVGTSNAGKLIEIQTVLRGLPLRVRGLSEFPGISPVAENGSTYRENAILKALGYAKQTGMPVLADDSGLEVDALNGAPGVLSARYGGPEASDDDRVQKLLAEIATVNKDPRTARFVAAIAFAGTLPPGSKHPEILHLAEGICEGTIAHEPSGTNGFGFDPIFFPAGYDKTFAELSSKIKNRISHRGQALRNMKEFLERWLVQT